ncbi:peptide chain release factor 2 [Candidatus Parcubacteria bacterium]|nr:peptide chain release factor 2 [Candidatus Parcubacteria bacterium]
MEELDSKINDLASKINKAIKKMDLDSKGVKLEQLKEQMSAADFWNNQDNARAVSTQASRLEEDIKAWRSLSERIADLQILINDKQAQDLFAELETNFDVLFEDYNHLSKDLLLQGKHDQSPAIITINAGAGGVDAQDWAQMLERMFLRFAEQQNWSVKNLARSTGSEAGIKSSTFRIQGEYSYGYLKNEAGVHRLVRLSPFDADHARHTSFAMIEVLPELSQIDTKIKEEDLKVDTFRASGHGGQSVNTTDSAVRITHIPTGLSAICQNERSQLQNKRQAMVYLQSRLQKYQEAEQEEEKKALKGEYTEAAWGNQIRSYVIHPYKMVKDHRTNYESSEPDKILDGQLMDFIEANLEDNIK